MGAKGSLSQFSTSLVRTRDGARVEFSSGDVIGGSRKFHDHPRDDLRSDEEVDSDTAAADEARGAARQRLALPTRNERTRVRLDSLVEKFVVPVIRASGTPVRRRARCAVSTRRRVRT